MEDYATSCKIMQAKGEMKFSPSCVLNKLTYVHQLCTVGQLCGEEHNSCENDRALLTLYCEKDQKIFNCIQGLFCFYLAKTVQVNTQSVFPLILIFNLMCYIYLFKLVFDWSVALTA